MAFVTGMSEACNVEDSVSPHDHIEHAATTPSMTLEKSALKRNDQVCADPKISDEAKPSTGISRDKNIDDLSSPPVSHTQVAQEFSEKETNVSLVSPSAESEKSANHI